MKKLWIALLVCCLALCAAACAEGMEFKLAGEGTAENPYLIATAEDLYHFAAVINGKDEIEYGQYIEYNDAEICYQLAADIELNDCAGFEAWETNPPANVWTPIGYSGGFRGVFDGNGHTISGLYINQTVAEDRYGNEMYQFGLFGNVMGTVRNLTVRSAFIHPVRDKDMPNPPHIGILAGESSGRIENCMAQGVLICEGIYSGGIAGFNSGEIVGCTFAGEMFERGAYSGTVIGGISASGGNICDCSVNARIICENIDEETADSNIGGIAGMQSAFTKDECIENCTFYGEIISGDCAGGIVGYAGAGSMKDVEPKTIIRNCVNYGSITSYEDAGGIVGLALNTDDVGAILVEGCVNKGEVHTLNATIQAAAGIAGYIDTRNDGMVTISGCVNESAISADMPAGIVGRIMQSRGNIRIENCTNRGAINGEGFYAAGILCHIQQWGDDWKIEVDGCVNEADITTAGNAGGIVCFTFSTENKNCSLSITDCVNRGSLRSEGGNNFMGGILGVNSLAKTPVTISGCTNEGDLEYTKEVLADKETLSGTMFTLSRTSGGIVGYVGTAPYLSVNSGERKQQNISVKNAWLNIENCASTGRFFHQEARLADDVDEELLAKWKNAGVDNVLDFFIALEGGVVGTVADNQDYSVRITDCTYANAESEIADWNQ